MNERNKKAATNSSKLLEHKRFGKYGYMMERRDCAYEKEMQDHHPTNIYSHTLTHPQAFTHFALAQLGWLSHLKQIIPLCDPTRRFYYYIFMILF